MKVVYTAWLPLFVPAGDKGDVLVGALAVVYAGRASLY